MGNTKKYRATERIRSTGLDAERGEILELDPIEGRHRRKRGQVERYEEPDSATDSASGASSDQYPEGWLELAEEALESDNGNKMRTALGKIDEAERTKPENKAKLEDILDAGDSE